MGPLALIVNLLVGIKHGFMVFEHGWLKYHGWLQHLLDPKHLTIVSMRSMQHNGFVCMKHIFLIAVGNSTTRFQYWFNTKYESNISNTNIILILCETKKHKDHTIKKIERKFTVKLTMGKIDNWEKLISCWAAMRDGIETAVWERLQRDRRMLLLSPA